LITLDSLPTAATPAPDVEGTLSSRMLAILDWRPRTKIIHRRGWLVRRMLVVGDVLGISLAFAATLLIYGDRGGQPDAVSLRGEVALFLISIPAFVFVAHSYGLYDRDEEHAAHSTIEEITGVFHLVTVGIWLMVGVDALLRLAQPNLPKVVMFWMLAVTLVPAARATARAICRRRPSYQQNTVIVGAGTAGQLVARKFLHHPEYGINVVGFVDGAPRERTRELESVRVLGAPDQLADLVRPLDIERIVVAFSGESDASTVELIRQLKEFDVQIDLVPRLFEMVSRSGATISDVEGLPLISLARPRLPRSSLFLKRAMDLSLSILGLVVLAPALALIALLIRLDSSGPILFRQPRIGFGGKPFTIFKFRTMVANAEEHRRELEHLNHHAAAGDSRLFKVIDDPRTTRVGRALRRLSLDELPQLLNVLKGEMSLVGPRPLILDEDRHVTEWARKRLSLKPGITGLWQMLGRNEIPFGEMVRLDYAYVTNWSLFNDFKILLRTLPEVFRVRNGC
jgi:exopolysaccharide biosynthesis polyprenyl glycosylphosphotransferase